MTLRPVLVMVEQADPPVTDIYAKDRAKIASIDWAAVMIAADKRSPIELSDRPRRWWRL